ncbi:hypothetical protein P691DRAFT_823347 [Macrolepiota fuliginosa MF-IS2]|uniref:Uncharacterized protein n=1 Tax=Macrolepiota fuliginosa MF-IS2 TaxID=1400762 RepID=A0A9P5XBL7_9AGAR|nr:hypothetical protein P691DRAFT_823347 [Macrolepiota fuliginosa MF-IS2]
MFDPQLLLWESLDLISSTTINGVLYGIALSLYVLASRALYPQLKISGQQKHAVFMFVYTSLVMTCGVILLVLSMRRVQLAYIDHNTFPGEPFEYLKAYSYSQPVGIGEAVFNLVNDVLTLGIQIWRLWVIYSATQYATVIVALPLLLFLSFIGMDIATMLLPTCQESRLIVDTGTIFASQLAITVLVTLLVVIRLLDIRRRHIELMPGQPPRQYINIAAMLIESYAIQSVWSIAGLISYFLGSGPAVAFLSDCSGVIEIIAYLLIIYRISTGRGWNRQTQLQLTSFRLQTQVGSGTSPQNSQDLLDVDIVASISQPLSHSNV